MNKLTFFTINSGYFGRLLQSLTRHLSKKLQNIGENPSFGVNTGESLNNILVNISK